MNSTVKRIEQALGDETLTINEIILKLKNQEKRTTSFTTYQLANLLRRKQFEKVGFCKASKQALWRNKNGI
ncbi:hypothetical protein [Marinobacter sp.]|uniref:hypothetical protein n=1 Tax=Marinobacter sp. TaxID=50741 RepID=UPI002355EFA6|nr:hypothetical protein [Marinobacter sp.]